MTLDLDPYAEGDFSLASAAKILGERPGELTDWLRLGTRTRITAAELIALVLAGRSSRVSREDYHTWVAQYGELLPTPLLSHDTLAPLLNVSREKLDRARKCGRLRADFMTLKGAPLYTLDRLASLDLGGNLTNGKAA